jgi:flagellar motility protein MotE (MotC chaperone)
MISLPRSPWLATGLAVFLYIATTAFLLRPSRWLSQAPRAPFPEEVTRNLGPSWAFKNPEVDQLLAELRREREALATREQSLKELESRLAAERQEISAITQQIARAQTRIDTDFIAIRQNEAANLKRLVKLYTTMSPENAAKVLLESDEEPAVKIFGLMKEAESAPILELMAKDSPAGTRRVSTITDRLRHIRSNPAPPSQPQAPPAVRKP